MLVNLIIIIINTIKNLMDIGATRMKEIISYLNMASKAAGYSLMESKGLSQTVISFLKLTKERMKMLKLILKIQILSILIEIF
jgi:hypothetical protein